MAARPGRPRRHLALCCVIASLAACGIEEATTPGPCDGPLADPVAAQGPLTIGSEGRLRDGAGRQVVLRGLNTGGRSKVAPFVPFPVTADMDLTAFRAAADTYFGRLPLWGLDSVRMPFSWAALEPAAGTWDDAWLERYVTMVDAAGDLGLRVVVDFHQDVYAEPFCGDGFPLWTLPPADRTKTCQSSATWFLKYFDPAVTGAFDRFYKDEDGRLQAFEKMWSKMAGRLKDHPAVIGFEILNEPGGYTSTAGVGQWKKDVLTPFHERLIAHLRKIAPDRLVFFDNPGTDALLDPVVHVRPAGEGIVYAPHVYDMGLIAGGKRSKADSIGRMATIDAFAKAEKLPVLLGEFGYGASSQSDDMGGPGWLAEVMDFIDAHGWSATLWEYSISPDKWNEEDLSVVNVDGSERPILDTYVRPWLRALAGSGGSLKWDAKAGSASATWTADGGVTELRVPARAFQKGPRNVTIEGSGACWSWNADDGALRVKAPAGTTVKLAFER